MDFVMILLQICGAISVIGGAVTLIIKLFNPYRALKNKLDTHAIILERDSHKLNHFDESNKVLCSCLYALLDHIITGNSLDELKKAKDTLNKFLINK